MAPPNPVDRLHEAETALRQAERQPLGSAGRQDALAFAQVQATLALIDVISAAATPRRLVLPVMPEGFSPEDVATEIEAHSRRAMAAPLLALPNEEDALLGLTHPPVAPKAPRKRSPRPKPPTADELRVDEAAEVQGFDPFEDANG